MEIQQDFKELLELFNKHHVEYMIVGGYALAFHGAPRFTGDMDLFVNADPDNADRIMAALSAFGFSGVGLTAEDFEKTGQVVQLGVPPVRVDIVTSLTGVSWDEAAQDSVNGTYGNVAISFIGRSQFITNRRSLGRKKDLADLEALGEG